VPKMAFDLEPKLTKTFDLVFWSSAIQSSDQIPINWLNLGHIHWVCIKWKFSCLKTILYDLSSIHGKGYQS
jgi:hypothetical protein